VYAASWSNSPNPAYSKDLIERLLQPGVAIGDAITASKTAIADHTFVEMYNLLGDPALVLARPRTELKLAATSERWDPRLIVRLPAADFGGTVDVDWVDAEGQILASRHYEARDRQFYLPLLDKAKKVLVYATDTRNGALAFGSFRVAEPPAPATGAALTPVPGRPPATTAAPQSKPAPSSHNPPDRIDSVNFDAAAQGAAPSRPSKRN
jgi:hypothetical protein